MRVPCAALRYRFAANVAGLRRARGWLQRELAAHCQCHTQFISNLEQGTVNATLATLEMLARGPQLLRIRSAAGAAHIR
jgi:transcriptional regulator with XRE-family HTH domain